MVSVAVACSWLVGCHKSSEPQKAPALETVTVTALKVERTSKPATEDVIGTVRSRLRAAIEAKVSGRIIELNATPGQNVKTGEVLARLDAKEIEARWQQAIAVRDQARTELARISRLLEQQAVTQQEFDATQSRARVAEASVEEAETMREYTTVRAPFDGVVTQKNADVGDLASPGKPLLGLEDPTQLRLEAHVPEAIIRQVEIGKSYPVKIDTIVEPLQGTAGEIDPTADPVSRTFLVKFDLPKSAALRAGQFGRAAIPIPAEPAIFVPRPAVVMRGQMQMVFVVGDGQANMRLVKTGRVFPDEVELISGVNEGEIIVVEGADHLKDGQPVAVRE